MSLGSVVWAVLQFAFYRMARGVPGLRDWAVAMAVAVFHCAMVAARPVLPVFVGVVVTNAIGLTAAVILYQGVRRFCGLRPAWGAPLAVVAACLTLLWLLYADDGYFSLRVIIYSAGIAAIGAMSAATLLRTAPAADSGGRKFAAGFFVLITVSSLVRLLWMVVAPPDRGAVAMAGVGGYVIYGWGLIVMLSASAALAVLSTEGLRRELAARVDEGDRLNRELADQLRDIAPEGAWIFDSERWTLAAPDQEPVALTASEIRLMVRLMAVPGQAVSREELCGTLGWTASGPEARNLDGLISRLRRKFSRSSADFPIKAVRNAGYAINAAVKERVSV